MSTGSEIAGDQPNNEDENVGDTPNAKDETKPSQDSKRLTTIEKELKSRTQERDAFKNRVTELEEQLAEARKRQQQNQNESQVVETLKLKSEEMLTRAKEVIFEKTKICKNQELQIEALTQQVSSLKEVVAITKDLLDIRNVEVKHLQSKLECMDEKIDAEKERQKLVTAKLEKMVQMNMDLKREYETQLCLFNALRERYNEHELARNVLDNLRRSNTDDANEETATSSNETQNQQ